MLFMMHSRTLDRIYMCKESYKTVTKTNYVIISSRIRKSASASRYKNILLAQNKLYPSAYVTTAIGDEDYIRNYREYLSGPEQMQELAAIVKLSCTIDYPVVLLSTVLEYKECLYMKVLAEFIQERFGCPVFNYKKNPSTEDVMTDELREKIIARCDAITKKATKRMHKINLKTADGITKIENRAEVTPKKKLKKILKKHGLYEKGLSRQEMVERYTGWCMDEPL